MSPRQMAYKRYMHHKGAVVCTVIMAILLVIVLLAPWTMRYGVNEAVFPISEGPNQYLSPRQIAWFGTDDIGRDLYSRMIVGLRVSFVIGLAAAIFSTIIGVTVGSVAGLRGGLFDDIVMRVTDVFLAFPFLVALLVVRAFLGDIPWLESIIGYDDVDPVRDRAVRVVRVDGRRAPRARPGAVAQGARVHRGHASPRREQPADHLHAPAAELASVRSSSP